MAEDKGILCRVVTPDDTVFEGEVSSLVLPGEEGQLGVLYNHTPYMAVLDVGFIKLGMPDGSDRFLSCGGGYTEINDNEVTLLVESAQFAGEIDVKQAEEDLEEVERELGEATPESDAERRRLNHERDLARMRIRTARRIQN